MKRLIFFAVIMSMATAGGNAAAPSLCSAHDQPCCHTPIADHANSAGGTLCAPTSRTSRLHEGCGRFQPLVLGKDTSRVYGMTVTHAGFATTALPPPGENPRFAALDPSSFLPHAPELASSRLLRAPPTAV